MAYLDNSGLAYFWQQIKSRLKTKADKAALFFEAADTSLWTIGTLKSADGTVYTSTNRIRTGLLSPGIKGARPATGYKMLLYVYNSAGTYQGVWNGTTTEKSIGTTSWRTDAVDFADLPAGSQVRLVAADTSDSAVTSSNKDTFAQGIVLTHYTDTGLTGEGVPADAAETGRQFGRALMSRTTLTSSDDMDDVTDPGVYFAGRYSGAGGFPQHMPAGFVGTMARILVVRTSTSIAAAWQLAVDYDSNLWFRGFSGSASTGSWSAWRSAGPAQDSISLSASWSGSGPYTQTVTLTNGTPTAHSKIDLQPDAAAIAQLLADGVQALYVANNNSTLTAYAIGAAPTAALTLQATVTEVV